MINIWQELEKPIFILAPMEEVTDTVFRQLVAKCAKPDLFFTEFTSVDGLCSAGKDHVIHRLQFIEAERPIIAQIWGNKPENFAKAAKMVAKMGFDGIDINMGCPVKNVMSHGSCAALINNKPLVKEIIQSTKAGARGLPVSVKTRIGKKSIETEEWITFLLEQDLDAISLHGRTAKELSKVPAHWEEIGKAVQIRNAKKSKTLIIGNGDVSSYQDGLDKVAKYGVDGIMIGRGIFQNMWIFDKNNHQPSQKENLQLLLDHVKLFEDTWGPKKNNIILRRFYKNYVSGFEGASEVREELMRATAIKEITDILVSHNLI